MKTRTKVIPIIVFGLLLVSYPFIAGEWKQRQMEKPKAYLRQIYTVVRNINTEREPLGRPAIQSLDEVMIDQFKKRLQRDGINWRDIHYYPQPDNAPDTNVLLSLTYANQVFEVKKGGALIVSRKK